MMYNEERERFQSEHFADHLEEEIGKEYITTDAIDVYEEKGQSTAWSSSRGLGYIALLFSLLSLFTAPVLFGTGGIIFGVMARNRGVAGLATTAIVIGALSIIGNIFF
ncbi:hypothetical protein [Fervidibacillus halotolerans]|uniref:DUF4190 domain-containing protein n=1 Tax=Fervidibacillus halotolerans TaxID=2980027 RepID=A0A9E8LXC7_9BACI|nr:hypothetical protein [Fervidibacillus halotolerans]WAA11473.1 hypothetical protein OE105_07465 [Fervidibacillus halotolerans]